MDSRVRRDVFACYFTCFNGEDCGKIRRGEDTIHLHLECALSHLRPLYIVSQNMPRGD